MGRPEESLLRQSDVSFVFDEAALVCKDAVAIADLHLGIESSFSRNGVFIPSLTKSLEAKLTALISECEARKLIIVGDVKNSIDIGRQEERELPDFFSSFPNTEIHIVKGNHDGNLGKLLPSSINLHPSEGFLLDEVYFSHGNAWPGKELQQSRALVMGHLHPGIEFRDCLGSRAVERCWLKCRLNKKALKERYPKLKAKEVIIMPSFNKLAGSMSITSIKPESPLLRSGAIDLQDSDIYLLDGVHIGKLSDQKLF